MANATSAGRLKLRVSARSRRADDELAARFPGLLDAVLATATV
jgi:hypothetical protein